MYLVDAGGFASFGLLFHTEEAFCNLCGHSFPDFLPFLEQILQGKFAKAFRGLEKMYLRSLHSLCSALNTHVSF